MARIKTASKVLLAIFMARRRLATGSSSNYRDDRIETIR